MTMFSMKPKFNLAEFLAENGPRKPAKTASKSKLQKRGTASGKTNAAENPDAPAKPAK